jgi:hypothetical protein
VQLESIHQESPFPGKGWAAAGSSTLMWQLFLQAGFLS